MLCNRLCPTSNHNEMAFSFHSFHRLCVGQLHSYKSRWIACDHVVFAVAIAAAAALTININKNKLECCRRVRHRHLCVCFGKQFCTSSFTDFSNFRQYRTLPLSKFVEGSPQPRDSFSPKLQYTFARFGALIVSIKSISAPDSHASRRTSL